MHICFGNWGVLLLTPSSDTESLPDRTNLLLCQATQMSDKAKIKPPYEVIICGTYFPPKQYPRPLILWTPSSLRM
jgi:hypothetical protein